MAMTVLDVTARVDAEAEAINVRLRELEHLLDEQRERLSERLSDDSWAA